MRKRNYFERSEFDFVEGKHTNSMHVAYHYWERKEYQKYVGIQ